MLPTELVIVCFFNELECPHKFMVNRLRACNIVSWQACRHGDLGNRKKSLRYAPHKEM